MRGTGLVGWGRDVLYAYFMVDGGSTRVRLSVDEADRLDVVQGLRVRLALPGREPADGLVMGVRREPPFAWVELAPLANRAG